MFGRRWPGPLGVRGPGKHSSYSFLPLLRSCFLSVLKCGKNRASTKIPAPIFRGPDWDWPQTRPPFPERGNCFPPLLFWPPFSGRGNGISLGKNSLRVGRGKKEFDGSASVTFFVLREKALRHRNRIQRKNNFFPKLREKWYVRSHFFFKIFSNGGLMSSFSSFFPSQAHSFPPYFHSDRISLFFSVWEAESVYLGSTKQEGKKEEKEAWQWIIVGEMGGRVVGEKCVSKKRDSFKKKWVQKLQLDTRNKISVGNVFFQRSMVSLDWGVKYLRDSKMWWNWDISDRVKRKVRFCEIVGRSHKIFCFEMQHFFQPLILVLFFAPSSVLIHGISRISFRLPHFFLLGVSDFLFSLLV